MEENQQRKQDALYKRLLQEQKEDEAQGIFYPSPVKRVNPKQEQAAGQVITTRTGQIQSQFSKPAEQTDYNDEARPRQSRQQELRDARGRPSIGAEVKVDIFSHYEAQNQARERQRQDWRVNLIQQMQEQESKRS